MTPKLRIAVVGCGQIAQWQHLPSLLDHPEAQVCCVCDTDQHRREQAARASGAEAVIAFEQVLASNVDAVLIATHDLSHAELVELALRAGKHVFVEKPLALETAAAERILALAVEMGLVVAVGFQRLHDPVLNRMASLLETVGRIGVVHMHDFCHRNESVISESLPRALTDPAFTRRRSDFGDSKRWRALAADLFPGHQANMLDTYRLVLNLACHDLSALVYLLGEPASVDYVDMWPELFGVILWRFDQARGVLEFGQTGRMWFDEQLRVIGNDGTLEARWATPFVAGIPTELHIRRMVDDVDTTVRERFTHRSLFRAEVWDFVNRITEESGRDASLENAVIVTRWLERAILHHVERLASADCGEQLL